MTDSTALTGLLRATQIDLLAEARWCLAELRRPPAVPGLPAPLRAALREARVQARREALRLEGEALWAAARRCQAGREWLVGWQRLDRELTPSERAVVCVNGRKGRRLASAWSAAKRAAARNS